MSETAIGMRDVDGPANLLQDVQTIVKPDAVGKEVMCCLGGKVYEAK